MKSVQPLNKSDFLESNDVREFVEWLSHILPRLKIRFEVKASKSCPNGLNKTVYGLEEATKNYNWKSSWKDKNGNSVDSCDWPSTKKSLNKLSDWLKETIESKDNMDLLNACQAVLDWGGVQGALEYVKTEAKAGNLVIYLKSKQTSLTLDQANLPIRDVPKYDSGMTKIHSLASNDGLPIYDSRVGAAVSGLVALYCSSRNKKISTNLRFLTGAARGGQIRDPSKLGYSHSSSFTYSNSGAIRWMECQVKCGWILSEFLRKTRLYAKEGDISARMHALEAGLFMIGYDVRTFLDPKK